MENTSIMVSLKVKGIEKEIDVCGVRCFEFKDKSRVWLFFVDEKNNCGYIDNVISIHGFIATDLDFNPDEIFTSIFH